MTMAEFGTHINRKSYRAIQGPFPSDRYIAYKWTKRDPPPRKSAIEENGWEQVRDRYDSLIYMEHAEAWRWQRDEAYKDDLLAPTVDEMIEAISNCLKQEMTDYMDWSLTGEEVMTRMYQVAKSPQRLTRAAW